MSKGSRAQRMSRHATPLLLAVLTYLDILRYRSDIYRLVSQLRQLSSGADYLGEAVESHRYARVILPQACAARPFASTCLLGRWMMLIVNGHAVPFTSSGVVTIVLRPVSSSVFFASQLSQGNARISSKLQAAQLHQTGNYC